VQSQLDAMLVEELAHRGATPRVELRHCVFAGIELDVDVTEAAPRRPFDCVFELQTAADVDADAITKVHRVLL
jgi:hypothetical protein